MTPPYDTQSLSLIEEHVRQLLQHMDFQEASVHCRQLSAELPGQSSPTLCIDIEVGNEGKLLIGTGGERLTALQHLVRTLLRRQLESALYIIVDVNGYRVRREKSLLSLAETTAHRAHSTGRTVVLRPMHASDRRAIHTALAARQDIKTESMGNEPNRRVVVRPVFL